MQTLAIDDLVICLSLDWVGQKWLFGVEASGDSRNIVLDGCAHPCHDEDEWFDAAATCYIVMMLQLANIINLCICYFYVHRVSKNRPLRFFGITLLK